MHLSFALPLQQILPHSPDSGSDNNNNINLQEETSVSLTSEFICLCLHVYPVIRMVVNEMMDSSELASSLCPSLSPLAQDILTVFQFHRYAVEHDVTDMERHLLDLAKEGKTLY